ncbi:uncharacterized protein ColSpa_01893 [Colletotrichum spaethianum]|uniref:SprT-like domain-containing protein n=1 Tax=Colletotrichum spaethianum TaxID=700344 RepID=A0AA37LCD9_9PEZI|nr:uncharacterized protein ColSpa_01893 [Colletotrichum spaethianum]GKT41712.1 hypothetical protein ColSpa_01893 [Colletotrichum spaethianum]
MTCGHFLDCELQAHQIAARDAFVKCYLEALPRAAPWSKLPAQSLKNFAEGNGSKQVEVEAAFLEGSLRSMMRHLDEYFFFGTMTRLQRGQKELLLVLQTGFGLLKADVSFDSYGDATTHGPDFGNTYTRVRLWGRISSIDPWGYTSSTAVEQLPFTQNVATLVHEMVHAYLNMFVCKGEQCKRNLLNTVGLTGHGSIFVKLYTLVLEEIWKWHPKLKVLSRNECIPGTAIVKKNIDVEAMERLKWKAYVQDRDLLPLRADSPRNLVCQTEKLIEGISKMSITYRKPGSKIPQWEETDENRDVDGVKGDVAGGTSIAKV